MRMRLWLYPIRSASFQLFSLINIIMPKLSKAWPGNNRFLLNCCITGPGKDTPGMVCVCCTQLAMIITFSIFMVQDNWNISPVLPILYYASCLLFNLFIVLTACTDPGIIPRRPFLMRDHSKYKMYLDKPKQNGSVFCQTCFIYRPKRASHCSSCQNCVQVFDHHCSVLGNCIGKRNYRYFSMFITCLIANFAIFVVNLVVYLINLSDNVVNDTVVIIILSIIGGIVGLPILLFSCFHLYLCVSGKTTREVLKNINKNDEEEEQSKWCFIDNVNIDFFEEVEQSEIQRLQTQITKLRNSNTVQNVYEIQVAPQHH